MVRMIDVLRVLMEMKCAQLKEITLRIAEMTGKQYSLNLDKDVHEALQKLVSKGLAVKLTRGIYCSIDAVAVVRNSE
jgi:predicted nucleic acid-binding Zn finger protein